MPSDPYRRAVFVAFLALWAVSCIQVPHPEYFALQQVPTLLAVAILIFVEKRQIVDRLGYTLLVLFLLLHVLGARYLYSYLPYDRWSEWWLGFRITDRFGFERNHYDRLVHFAFGILLVYPLRKFFVEHLSLRSIWPSAAAVCVILAASGAYEMMEWAVAVTFAPDWAEAYNGQQGDVWDAQRDMAFATAGSLVSAGFIGFRRVTESMT